MSKRSPVMRMAFSRSWESTSVRAKEGAQRVAHSNDSIRGAEGMPGGHCLADGKWLRFFGAFLGSWEHLVVAQQIGLK